MSKVHQFIARHSSVDGYDLICFLESYSRLVKASVADLLQEGLDYQSIAEFYINSINRLKRNG